MLFALRVCVCVVCVRLCLCGGVFSRVCVVRVFGVSMCVLCVCYMCVFVVSSCAMFDCVLCCVGCCVVCCCWRACVVLLCLC